MARFLLAIFLLPLVLFAAEPVVELGVDRFFSEGYQEAMKGKKIGLITNHTGVNRNLVSTIDLFLGAHLNVVAFFAPEHGIDGLSYANEKIEHVKGPNGIPIYSLHGKTRHPTEKMLKNIDVLIYDIQDIGARSYTFATTLFYVMEEAAKKGIEVIVLDRPNPINGTTIDGPMLEEKWRSFIGYINVPYCHGMTIGELARFFNEEYKVGCKLKIISMKGWKRSMSFKDTGLAWIPTSPNIPEPDTPLFYASTGMLGELSLVDIGVGFSMPFKLIGAPWINAKAFADRLNEQKLPGVHFVPYHYKPFFGNYKGKDCQGVKIVVTSNQTYRPLAVQFLIMGILKTMYPKEIEKILHHMRPDKKNLFCKASGNEEMYALLCKEKYVAWKLIQYQKEERKAFSEKRKKYLLY